MRANLFWFSDGQWARIEPFIPSNRRGVKPKNNRRILSGIMHVLKSGCRWVDCPPEYGPAKRSTIASTAGVRREFGRASSRRWPNLLSRRNEWPSTARISKRIAALAAGKGGVGTGDWHHPRRAQQPESRPCR